jgi:hypothetical protein
MANSVGRTSASSCCSVIATTSPHHRHVTATSSQDIDVELLFHQTDTNKDGVLQVRGDVIMTA